MQIACDGLIVFLLIMDVDKDILAPFRAYICLALIGLHGIVVLNFSGVCSSTFLVFEFGHGQVEEQ